MSLECGNAACCKTLTPPFLQCAKCKAAAYCSKECQVPPPPNTYMQRAAPEPARTDPKERERKKKRERERERDVFIDNQEVERGGGGGGGGEREVAMKYSMTDRAV